MTAPPVRATARDVTIFVPIRLVEFVSDALILAGSIALVYGSAQFSAAAGWATAGGCAIVYGSLWGFRHAR